MCPGLRTTNRAGESSELYHRCSRFFIPYPPPLGPSWYVSQALLFGERLLFPSRYVSTRRDGKLTAWPNPKDAPQSTPRRTGPKLYQSTKVPVIPLARCCCFSTVRESGHLASSNVALMMGQASRLMLSIILPLWKACIFLGITRDLDAQHWRWLPRRQNCRFPEGGGGGQLYNSVL